MYSHRDIRFLIKRGALFLLICLFFFVIQFIYGHKDSDGDGIPDYIECPGNINCPDSDGDGIPDMLDTDSDNDGIEDSEEKAIPGTLRSQRTRWMYDTDNDGIPNYRDADDDGDGIPTRDEYITSATYCIASDSDNDGIPNHLDTDDDGDGIPTIQELHNPKNPGVHKDTDNDGIPNYLDSDDDNDGIPTQRENKQPKKPGMYPDTDNDGISDYLDSDDDNDGIPTRIERNNGPVGHDRDNDGILDHLDKHTFFSDTLDSDGDGLSDGIECGQTALCIDTDNDGVPNHLDTDSDSDGGSDRDEGPISKDDDHDGVPNVYDPYPSSTTTPSGPEDDPDGDGLTNKQEDRNHNGNRTDDDSDGDYLPDYLDKDQYTPTYSSSDGPTRNTQPTENEEKDEQSNEQATNIPMEVIGPHRCPHPFGGYPLIHGDNIVAYEKSEVTYPEVCVSVSQERTCQYGALQGTYTFASCKQVGKECTSPNGEKISHRSVSTYYKDDEVTGVPRDGEDLCIRQARRCLGGEWRTVDEQQQSNFTYVYSICKVKSPN